MSYRYTIKMARYGESDYTDVSVYATEKYSYDDYLRAFVQEFQPMVPMLDFHDALICLIRDGKAVFQSDEYQRRWEVSLCKK